MPFLKLPPRRIPAAAAAALCWLAGTGLSQAESPPIPKTADLKPATVGTGKTTLWKVKGAKNTVYLLGSVHILRPEHLPLPAAMDAAYADSKVLVLEVTSKESETPEAQALTMSLGLNQDGSTLQSKLSPETYALFKEKATAVGVPPAQLDTLKPWLAGIVVVMQQLTQAGYDMESGVDKQYEAKALAENKPIEALESVKFQLGLFDSLSSKMGDEFLKQMLVETENMTKMLDDLVASWKKGDGSQIDALLSQSFKGFEDIEKAMLTDRNTTWVGKLESDYLKRDENILVVVGAGHLVGKNSVNSQLIAKGYALEQL